MKFKKKIVFSLLFVSSSLFAFSVNGAVSDIVGDTVNGLGSQFGLPAFQVRCDVGLGNISLYSICDIVDKLELDLGLDFKIGACTIRAGDPLECQREALKSFCRSNVRKALNAVGKYQVQVTNSIVNSTEDIIGTGGLVVGDLLNCNFIKDAYSTKKTESGKTLKEIYDDSTIKIIKKNGLFNTLTEEIRDCLKVVPDDEKCYDTATWTLPKSMSDADESISTTVEQSSSKTTSYIKAAIETESQLSKDLYNKCKNSLTPQKCVDDEIKDSELTKKRDVAIVNIETSAAIRKKNMKVATRTNRSFVFRGDEVINRLPMEMKADYISGVSRVNSSEVVFENLHHNNTSLEKEGIIVLDNKIIDASEPYLQGASNIQIKNLFGI